MELEVRRRWLTDEATVGELWINGTHDCFTCEDRYRPPPEPKVPKQTCIPLGRYRIIINRSQRFKVDMPLLLDVPMFEGVRIHPGNTAADTEGCILLGESRGPNRVFYSRVAYHSVFTRLRAAIDAGEQIHIAVTLSPEG